MLQIVGLYKSWFGMFAPVLKNINLHLLPGEFCILIGSNGSGKSTLLKTITGEYKADNNSILTNSLKSDINPLIIKLNGEDITLLPMHLRSRLISSVYQDLTRGIVQEMTLFENLVLSKFRLQRAGFKFYKHYENNLILQIKDLNLGLEEYLHQSMSVLSGGQKQIIATIMALYPAPKLLLLDEPTSALDPKIQKQLMEYTIKIINEQNITTIMVTHNLEDAVKYGNRLIMLHDGQIVLDINSERKRSLTVEQLLELFHSYEDSILLRGN